MDLEVLAVPVRTGVTASGLGHALSEYIEYCYDRSPGQFSQDVDQFVRLRDRAVAAINSQKFTLEPVVDYLCELDLVIPKFPQSLDCLFVWDSTLGYAVGPVESKSLQFDRVNILYNLGAKYSIKARDDAGYDLRFAFQYMQCAAWCFRAAADCDYDRRPIGLCIPTLRFVEALCLAQAQEFFWAKARNDGVKAWVLAKLAQGCSRLYLKALQATNKTSAVPGDWVAHLQFKFAQFEGVAHYRQSLVCLEKGQYGEEVAHLQKAKDACNHVLQSYSQKTSVAPLVISNLTELRNRVTSDVIKAEKDNDLIYMQVVPRKVAPIKPSVVSTSHMPQALKDPHPGRLFSMLMPFDVAHARVVYKERLERFVADFICRPLDILDHEVHAAFRECKLPGLIDRSNEREIPQYLVEYGMQVNQIGGVEMLAVSVLDLNNLAAKASTQLGALAQMLDGLRDGIPIHEEYLGRYGQLANYYDIALGSDKKIEKKISSCENLLGVLAGGQSAISKFLPRPSSTATTHRAPSDLAEGITEIMHKLQSVMAKRQEFSKQVKKRAYMMDLSKPIRNFVQAAKHQVSDAGELEHVYIAAVSGFDDDLAYVKQEELAQHHLLQQLRQKCHVFTCTERTPGAGFDGRRMAIEALQMAYDEFQDIISNLEDGRRFYNRLMAKISQLQSDCEHLDLAPAYYHPTTNMNPQSAQSNNYVSNGGGWQRGGDIHFA